MAKPSKCKLYISNQREDGTYFVQFKVASSNGKWSKLYFNTFCAKLCYRHDVKLKFQSISSFSCMTINQDDLNNQNFISSFLMCPNEMLSQNCGFCEFLFVCLLAFCLWHLSVRKHKERHRLHLFLWKKKEKKRLFLSLKSCRAQLRSCALHSAPRRSVMCTKLQPHGFQTCCHTFQSLC